MTATNPIREGDFDFTPEHDGSLPIETAVFQAIGAASVCWESMSGTGVFDSDRAKQIGERLLEVIAEQQQPTVDERLLRTTTNASVWAHEFMKLHPLLDEGAMIAWFANAIERGRDAGINGEPLTHDVPDA